MQYRLEESPAWEDVPFRDVTESQLPDAASTFGATRPQLFGIAYRKLGSAVEAEDIVQEAWIRWQNCDRSAVRDVQAFLATVIKRLASNAENSARARRETSVGWLPDRPDESRGPERAVELENEVELALGLVLAKLTPTERAAFLLRKAFDYSYEEIASLIEQTEPSVRQQVSRARKHLASARQAEVGDASQRTLVDAFTAACRRGDMSALENLLAAEGWQSKARGSHRATNRRADSVERARGRCAP